MLGWLLTAAWATVPDLYGMGARAQGAGTGGAAWANDPSAAFLNPSALGRIRRGTAAVGLTVADHSFRQATPVWWDTNRDGVLDERDTPLELDANPAPATGITLSAGRHLGKTWGIGVAAYVPTNNLILYEMFEPSLPHWVMYNNRLQRLVGAVGVGGRVFPGLSIGGGVNLLAKADVTAVASVDATLQASDEQGDAPLTGSAVFDGHAILFRVKPALAPILGMTLEPGAWAEALEGLSVALAYHGGTGFDINADIDLQANVHLQDAGELEPVTTAFVLKTKLAMLDHFVPPRTTIGASYARDGFAAYAELRHNAWRRYRPNIATVAEASLESPLLRFGDAIEDGNPYALQIRSTVALRFGTEITLPRIAAGAQLEYLDSRIRAGFAWEQTPVGQQGLETRMLDTDRAAFTLGVGFESREPLHLVDGPVRLDLFGQLHLLTERVMPRDSTLIVPGGTVDGSNQIAAGRIGVFGVQLGLAY